MKNIEIVLRSDYTNGSGDDFRMYFSFQQPDGNEIGITTVNKLDNSQHDFSLTKEDYLFLRKQLDDYFVINVE